MRQRARSGAAFTNYDNTRDAGTDTCVDAWLRGSAAYASVITRSRYAEDALHSAVARGFTQYVLVGAGFDSYVLRTPPESVHVSIYEVDHLATQSLKCQRILECGLSVRDSVRFLAADLSTESLSSVLARSAFDSTKPAFFSSLGVTTYLTREANLGSLRSIASSTTAGSELVFTYVDQAAFESHKINNAAIGKSVASIDEPFLSGFDPKTLAQDLRDCGFTLLEDLPVLQLVERYDPRGLNRLRPAQFSRIAHARVTGPYHGDA